ncbi:Pol protein, partial [Phytophthora palmivora]
DSGASTNFARRQTVVRNGDQYADALRESEGRGQVSVRLADDMDKYDLILGMPWLEKHEPWIDWRGKAIGASRPAVSDRALAPEEVLGVTDSNEDVAVSLATGHETKAHCQARAIATTASPNAESRRAVWASTVAVPDGTDQAGNIGPQAAEAAEESAKGVGAESASGVGNIVPHKVEETEKIESAACVSSVGNRVPRGVKKTSTSAEVSLSISRVDNQVPHSESETPPARPVEELCHVFDGVSGRQVRAGADHLEALPEVSALLNLEELSMKDFLAELKAGEIAEMVLLKPETSPEDLNSSSVMDEDVLEGFTKQRATRLGSEILKNPEDPVYPLVKEYSDVMSKHPPSQLPPDRGVRHEIDLVPGTKYCVTRRWPLPREQCEVIDAFFAEKAKSGMVRESKSLHADPRKDLLLNNMSGCMLYSALDLVDGYYQILMRESDIPLTAVSTPSGMLWEWLGHEAVASTSRAVRGHRCLLRREGMVRESKSPYSTPTFCVRKPNGKWRLVHAYNKLNNATVPAQTPIPRKDVLLNNMSGCTLYSALDLVDGYYQILMRESDISLTAVSTPNGMLWEWLVMPQGLSNAPATFFARLFRPLPVPRMDGQTAMAVHRKHLRRVFEVMRAN